jgi:hypothetical protein
MLLVFLSVAFLSGTSVVMADEDLPIVRIEVMHPRQVAPSTSTPMTIDIQYYTHYNVTIKAAMFAGTPSQLGPKLWESNPVSVNEGGDQLWSAELTAPSREGNWVLTAIGYFQQDGNWTYWNDTGQGPGIVEVSIKIAEIATLELDLGIPNVSVTIGNSTVTTTAAGSAASQLPVGLDYEVSVPTVIDMQNSTRLVFLNWNDGSNKPRRVINLDGDTILAPAYKKQYLLQLYSSNLFPAYSSSNWYDAGSNVVLQAAHSIPTLWPLGALGLRYVFRGWAGAVQSNSNSLNITMDGPKTVSANFQLEYDPIPTIILIGIIGGLVLALLRKREAHSHVKSEQEASQAADVVEADAEKVCEECGEPVQEDWRHCPQCGKELTPGLSDSSSSESFKT